MKPLIREADTFVYLMRNNRNGLIKIGESINPTIREKTLQSEEPEVELIASWKGWKGSTESGVHEHFAEKRVRGEWFRLTMDDIFFIRDTIFASHAVGVWNV